MKVLKVLLVVMFVIGIASIAGARNLEEVAETAYDTLRGANANCPLIMETYVAKTWKDAANLPVVGKADIRVKLGYEFDSHNLTDRNQVNLSAGLEF